MRGLEKRIALLERAIHGPEPVSVILSCFDDGELTGYRWQPYGYEPVTTIRRAGESEAQLLKRAEATAIPVNGLLVLNEVRAN